MRCRSKASVPDGLSDREIFTRMPIGDLWEDAELQSVYLYLVRSSKTTIPDSWQVAMEDFTCAVERSLPNPILVQEHNALQMRR